MKNYLLLAALVLAGCATPVTKAPWKSFPGARVEGACDRYAKAAQEDLTLRGVSAYYTVYSWSARGNTGRHACVLFSDESGWWLLDNIMAFPVRVRGETVMKMVKSYDSDAYIVWETSDCPLPTDWF